MKRKERNTAMLIARKDAGLTQADLAAEVGRSRAWINKLENKLEEPSIELAHLVAEKLNTPPEELFGEKYRK